VQRALLVILLVCGLTVPAFCQEVRPAAQPKAPTADKSQEQALKENPNDAQAINAYAMQVVLDGLNGRVPLARFDELLEFLDQLPATTPAAKAAVRSGKERAIYYRNMLSAGRTTLADLQAKLAADPDDERSIAIFAQKVKSEVEKLTKQEPDNADKLLEDSQSRLDRATALATKEAAQRSLKLASETLAKPKTYVANDRRLAEVIGKNAVPLEADAWLNGTPLEDGDLKGKVVLLDFFAVWCGPCIATFPELRKWHDKFAEQGLVIVGVSRYYNYRWDSSAGHATAVEKDVEQVPPSEEQAMMQQFTAHHKLPYRIAMTADRSLHDFYGGNYIPHVVVIDRQGKIRFNNSGGVAQQSRQIEELIEKLIGDNSAAGP
jgi:thiol-disulfide isomerase/thioredoxin